MAGDPKPVAKTTDASKPVAKTTEPLKAVVLTAQKFPDDWKVWTEDQKKNWLNNEPLPSDPTVSLLSCYKRGVRMTHVFSLLVDVLRHIKLKMAGKVKDSKVYKAAVALVKAFNDGIYTFSNEIAKGCETLLNNGKYDEQGVVLGPATIEPMELDDLIEKPKKTTVDEAASAWTMFSKLLGLICDGYPVVNQIRSGMNASYATLLRAFMQTGTIFFNEYTKEEGGQHEAVKQEPTQKLKSEKDEAGEHEPKQGLKAEKDDTAKHDPKQELQGGKDEAVKHEPMQELKANKRSKANKHKPASFALFKRSSSLENDEVADAVEESGETLPEVLQPVVVEPDPW